MTNTEIREGEYVRTKDGYIRKVTQYNEKGSYDCLCWGACMVDKDYKHSKGISLKKIKKHSFNLIDLIEVGDYVNGSFIIRAAKDCVDDEGTPIILAENYDEWSDNGVIYNEDIKTIVTKERFASAEYRVETN